MKGRAGTQAQAWVLPVAPPAARSPTQPSGARTLAPGEERRQEGKGGQEGGGKWERDRLLWRRTFLALYNRAAAVTTLFYGCLGGEMARPKRPLISSA